MIYTSWLPWYMHETAFRIQLWGTCYVPGLIAWIACLLWLCMLRCYSLGKYAQEMVLVPVFVCVCVGVCVCACVCVCVVLVYYVKMCIYVY